MPDDPSAVFEIRALECTPPGFRTTRTFGGYFSVSQIDKAADAAAHLTKPASMGGCNAKAVYFTLNPVLPDLLARRSNRVDLLPPRESSTSDREIISRRWMLVDCDPKRPSGVSSSPAEQQAAESTSIAIRDHLTSIGWPLPIEADSGNGRHLLYRINLPADDGGIIQRCLQALAARFSSPAVDVDTSVFNPARICKLYGTYSRKGDSTEQRPHRRSRITQGPREGFGIVPEELLSALASEAPEQQKHSGKSRRSSAPQSVGDRVRAWLQKRGPSIAGQHGHDDAWFTACTLVRGFNLSIHHAFAFISEWNLTCEPPWSDHELMHKLRQAEEKAEGDPGYMLTGLGMPSDRDSIVSSINVSGITFSEFTGSNSAKIPAPILSSPGNRDGPSPSRQHDGWLKRLNESVRFLEETK